MGVGGLDLRQGESHFHHFVITLSLPFLSSFDPRSRRIPSPGSSLVTATFASLDREVLRSLYYFSSGSRARCDCDEGVLASWMTIETRGKIKADQVGISYNPRLIGLPCERLPTRHVYDVDFLAAIYLR